MAKLFLVTAIQDNTTRFSPPCAVYLNPNNVVDAPSVVYTDDAGDTQIGTLIAYSIAGKNKHHYITVSEPPSTVLADMAAPTGGDDAHSIALTIIDRQAPNQAFINQIYKKASNVNINDIWWMQMYPDWNDNALIVVQNQTRTGTFNLRTEESSTDLAAAANA